MAIRYYTTGVDSQGFSPSPTPPIYRHEALKEDDRGLLRMTDTQGGGGIGGTIRGMYRYIYTNLSARDVTIFQISLRVELKFCIEWKFIEHFLDVKKMMSQGRGAPLWIWYLNCPGGRYIL